MEKILKLTVCALALFFLMVQANNDGFTNYADMINLNYTNGIWQCDLKTCPEKTYRCDIIYENNPYNRSTILRKNHCFLSNGSFFGLTVLQDMAYNQNVNINVTSYVGASNAYGVGFALNYQSIQGTVAPNGWPAVQQIMNEAITSVVNRTDISFGN